MHFDILQPLAGLPAGVLAHSNTGPQLGRVSKMVENGILPILIVGPTDDAAGLRKLDLGHLDAVYSNGGRGRRMLTEELVTGSVLFSGGHPKIRYYGAVNKDYPNQELVYKFFRALRDAILSGKPHAMIQGYGLKPGEVEQPVYPKLEGPNFVERICKVRTWRRIAR